jgi:hypothetical protein
LSTSQQGKKQLNVMGFLTERQAKGGNACYKARLCRKWSHGMGFNATLAHLLKFIPLRAIFSGVANINLHCQQAQVDCAFLCADLDKEIYMDQPN